MEFTRKGIENKENIEQHKSQTHEIKKINNNELERRLDQRTFDDGKKTIGANDSVDGKSDITPKEKRFEDYTTSELMDMAATNPEKVAALNADYRERYEAYIRGMTQDEYKDFKNELDAAKTKAEMDENADKGESLESKKIDEKVQFIENKIKEGEDARFADADTQKKAIGANLISINEIKECKEKIAKEKEAIEKQRNALIDKNPTYNYTNNQEYKNLYDRYQKLESYETKLASYEGTYEARNYDMYENLKNRKNGNEISYCSQLDNYRYGKAEKSQEYDSFENYNNRKMDVVEQYIGDLESKVSYDKTQVLDKFQLDFQKSRIESELKGLISEKELEKIGTPEERDRASKLTERLNEVENKLDEKYKDYKLYDNGTIQKETKTHYEGKTIYIKDTSDSPTVDRKGYDVTNKTEVVVGSNDTVTKVESILITGEETGKRSKQVTYDKFKAKSETTRTKINEDGEKITKISTSEINAGHGEMKAELDKNRGIASISGSASALRARGEYKHQEGNKTTTTDLRVNAGNIAAAAKYDMPNLSTSVSAKTNVAEVSLKQDLGADGHKTSFEIKADILGASAKAGFDKLGVTASTEAHKGSGEFSITQDGVKVVSLSPNLKNEDNKVDVSYSENEEARNIAKKLDPALDLSAAWKRNEKEFAEKPREVTFDKTETPKISNDILENRLDQRTFDDDGEKTLGANDSVDEKSDITPKEKRFEDYTASELNDMKKTNFEKVVALNTDYQKRFDQSGEPHNVFELNKKFDEIKADDSLTPKEKAEKINRLNEQYGGDFTKEGEQLKMQTYMPEFVKDDSPKDDLYVDFPDNEGIENAKPLSDNYLTNTKMLFTRYAQNGADDNGYNYSELIDGKFPNADQLATPYIQDASKNKKQIFNGVMYKDVINALQYEADEQACDNLDGLNGKYGWSITEDKFRGMKAEYDSLQEKFRKIKDNDGKDIDTKFGVEGTAKPNKVEGAKQDGGAVNIDLALRNRTLEELGVIQSDAPVTREVAAWSKEWYESDGSLEEQIKMFNNENN